MSELIFDHAEIRRAIVDLEELMDTLPQLPIPSKIYICDGLYAREMLAPKGALIVGEIHLKEHLSVVIGDITVIDENGARRITGYDVITAKPGIKRVGFCHHATIWTTIHNTDLQDIEEIESSIKATGYDDPRLKEAMKCLSLDQQ